MPIVVTHKTLCSPANPTHVARAGNDSICDLFRRALYGEMGGVFACLIHEKYNRAVIHQVFRAGAALVPGEINPVCLGGYGNLLRRAG